MEGIGLHWRRGLGRAVRKGWWIGILFLGVGMWFLWRDALPSSSDALPVPAAVDTEILAGRSPGAPSTRKIAVDVKGAVKAPGVYELPPGSRVKEVLEAAGGALDSAELAGINLAAKVEDGAMVVVPVRPSGPLETGIPPLSGENIQGGREGGLGANVGSGRTNAAPPAPGSGGIVHLNSGSVEDLDRLPGIGKSKAEAIVQYRLEHGPFPSVDRLADVPGIGPKLLDRIRAQVDLQ